MIGDRLSAFLFLLVLGFGALAAWQWQAATAESTPLVAAASQSVPLAQSSAPGPVAVAPLVELTQTVQRPLFNRTRRPSPPAVVVTAPKSLPVVAANSVPMTIELSAVILEPERQFALFRQSSQGTMLKAEVGQSVDGWVLSEIRGDGVSLERGAERQELVLRTFKAPVRKPVARKAPARGDARTRRARARAAQRRTGRGREANQAAPADKVQRPRRQPRTPRRRSIQRQRQEAAQ